MRVYRRAFISGALSLILGGLVSGTAAIADVPTPTIKPEAPVSPWVTPGDEATLRQIFEALDDRQYTIADALRSSVDEPIARSVADWAYLRSNADNISPQEIGRFLDRHYGWPDSERIQAKAEKAFDLNSTAAEILAFFQERDPVTKEGHLELARAFLAQGNEDAARGQLRRAWIDYNWSSRDERAILNQYGTYLTPEDHWAKADRQLFDIHATATQRLLNYLPSEKRREALVRIAFLKIDRNAPGLYNSLPQSSAQDSGVLHAATRYYRRSDNEEQALLYAGLAPLEREALRDPGAWYYERKLLARWALKTGRFNDAYVLSAYSGLEEGADFAEAEFMAGWVALRFLGDPERAKAHFAFLSTGVTSPISRSRGEYWLGRAWGAAGDATTANQHYRVAAAYPFTYYGQLAIHHLGNEAPRVMFPPYQAPDAGALTIFEARPMVHAMRVLAEVGENYHFDRFARALDDQIESEGEVAAYYDLVMAERKTYLAVRAGKVARNNGTEVPAVIFPIYPVPELATRYVEEPLILGLSRQESEFNPAAYSRARARGMMQLLDSTARITARKEGLPYSTSRLMSDPSYNFTIGAAHLNHLLDRFNGSYVMVLAAYNAGPHRVDDWIDTYGDPRDPNVDPIDWVELIPFSETRNYVMRVLENTQVYRARLYEEPLGGRLYQDLLRGGNSPSSFGITPPAPKLWQVAMEDGGGPDMMNRPSYIPLAVDRYPNLEFPPINARILNDAEGVDGEGTPDPEEPGGE